MNGFFPSVQICTLGGRVGTFAASCRFRFCVAGFFAICAPHVTGTVMILTTLCLADKNTDANQNAWRTSFSVFIVPMACVRMLLKCECGKVGDFECSIVGFLHCSWEHMLAIYLSLC